MWPLHTKAGTKHHVSLWTLWMLQSNSVPVSLTCPWTVWMCRTGSWSFSVASVHTAGHLEDHTPAHRQCVWQCVEDVKAANSSAVTQLSLQRPSTAAHKHAFTINYRLCASALHVSPKTMHHSYTTSWSEKHQWSIEDQVKKESSCTPAAETLLGLHPNWSDREQHVSPVFMGDMLHMGLNVTGSTLVGLDGLVAGRILCSLDRLFDQNTWWNMRFTC